MNAPSRRERIEEMLQAEPQDVFLRYSLAMELQQQGELELSLERFRELMRERPPHLPSFHMSARVLLKLRRVEEARVALREGIECARTQGDHRAASEMSELLIALGNWQE